MRTFIAGAIVGYTVSWGMFSMDIQRYAQSKMKPELITRVLDVGHVEVTRGKPIPTILLKKIKYSSKELECLTKNIFFEAGVESLKGKIAVAQVTLNRLATGRWGTSICHVVYAKAQFSWTLSKKKRSEIPKGKLWHESQLAVRLFVDGGVRLLEVGNSLFYHTDYIREPAWAHQKYKMAQVGQHIFYERDYRG